MGYERLDSEVTFDLTIQGKETQKAKSRGERERWGRSASEVEARNMWLVTTLFAPFVPPAAPKNPEAGHG